MESEKDEVSLVVEGDDLPAHKLRVLRKESGKQPTDGVSQAGAEVIENYLRRVFRWIFTSSLQKRKQKKVENNA